MKSKSSEDRREPWCASLAGASLATLRATAAELDADKLRRLGYDYCYLNLLTLLGDRYSTEQLYSLTTECMRNHLLSGEEFHAYCLAARGQRPWDNEIQALHAGIQMTPRGKLIMQDLLARGGVIVAGFHWGAFRFIPFALSSLGFPVKAILGEAGIGRYGSYFQFSDSDRAEMLARGVPESFCRISTIGTHRESDLLSALKSLKRNPAALFIPVDGMFTAAPSRSSAEISFGGVALQVKANPARLAAALQVPLVALFAAREDAATIMIDVAEVIAHDPARAAAQPAMQSLYRTLEERVKACPEQWEGARTFHHLRKLAPSSLPARPSPEDISAVRSGVESGLLAFNRSRVACIQIPGGGRTWVDSRTLECFGRTTEALETLSALGKPDAMGRLWREICSDEKRGQSLIYFLGQLHAAGLLNCLPASSAGLA